MRLKALSLALAQTVLPTFSKETGKGNPTKRSKQARLQLKREKDAQDTKRQQKSKG